MDAHAPNVEVERRLRAIDNKIKLLKRHLDSIEDMVTEIRVVNARTQATATPMIAAVPPPMTPTTVPSTPVSRMSSESSGSRSVATVEGAASDGGANNGVGPEKSGLADDVGREQADKGK